MLKNSIYYKILLIPIFALIFISTSFSIFAETGSSTGSKGKLFSAGISIVDSNPGINARFYFNPRHSAAATVGPVEGGTFFNVAYLYDYYSVGSSPLIIFYGGGGIISTSVSVSAPFYGKKTFSATGLWIPFGLSLNFDFPLEVFAELDLVVYTGAYSGSDVTYSIGARYYF